MDRDDWSSMSCRRARGSASFISHKTSDHCGKKWIMAIHIRSGMGEEYLPGGPRLPAGPGAPSAPLIPVAPGGPGGPNGP